MQPILTGMRIIEGSAIIAAPMCGMTLAQLGADVIRFDQIGGGIDYRRWPVTDKNNSIYWAEMNKGKRSIAVNIRSDAGRELLADLICAPGDNAGIFSTNLPATGMLAYEELSLRRPDLIQHEIVGNRHGTSALDYTVNAKVGFPFVTGRQDDERPVNHVLPAWDIACAYHAAIDILAADRYRKMHGTGQKITLALADVALASIGHLGLVGEVHINDEERGRWGNHLYGAFGRDFVTSDNERIMLIAASIKQWNGLIQASGLQKEIGELEEHMNLDFSREGERFVAIEELCALFEPWVAKLSLSELSPLLDAHGICLEKYQTIGNLVRNDPDCSPDNPIFETIEQVGIGEYPVPSNAAKFSSVERCAPVRAPEVGEHTDEILSTILNLDSSVIGKLHDQGIVA